MRTRQAGIVTLALVLASCAFGENLTPAGDRPKLVSDGGSGCDAGNANAVKCGERQCVVYYTGKRPHCAVMSLTLP